MLIRDCKFTAIDFESAGASPGHTDVPVQIGLISWSVKKGLHDPYVSYLQTEQPITWGSQKVHGITTEDLKDAPSFLSLWPLLRERLGDSVVVAHSCGTEKRFLRTFPGHQFGPWVDTLHLIRVLDPDASSHKLGPACASHGIAARLARHVPGKKWHDALYDAAASALLLERFVETYELADSPLENLTHPDLTAYHKARRNRNFRHL